MKRISITMLGFAAMMTWLASSSFAWSAPSPTWEKTQLKDLSLRHSSFSTAEQTDRMTQIVSSRPAILLAWGNDDCSNTNISVSFRTIGSVDRPMLSPPYPCSYLPPPTYDYPIYSEGRSGYVRPAPQASPRNPAVRTISQCWNFNAQPAACGRAPGCFWDAYLYQCRPYRM